MLPDIEQVVIAHLRNAAELTTLTTSIGTRTPPSTDLPWVRVALIHATPHPSSPALHAADVMVQCDCYGGANRDLAQGQASALARTVQAALTAMPATAHSGAVVTAARTSGPRRIPDTDFKPARERYTLTCDITTHAA